MLTDFDMWTIARLFRGDLYVPSFFGTRFLLGVVKEVYKGYPLCGIPAYVKDSFGEILRLTKDQRDALKFCVSPRVDLDRRDLCRRLFDVLQPHNSVLLMETVLVFWEEYDSEMRDAGEDESSNRNILLDAVRNAAGCDIFYISDACKWAILCSRMHLI